MIMWSFNVMWTRSTILNRAHYGVGMFLDRGRVCVFVIDGEDQHDQMAKISTISSVAIMERSAV
jgi:hypothetical protein